MDALMYFKLMKRLQNRGDTRELGSVGNKMNKIRPITDPCRTPSRIEEEEDLMPLRLTWKEGLAK
jgi:hypothetical protein